MQYKALFLAALALTAFTGCGSNSESGTTIQEEDLPYGATMRLEKDRFSVPVQYDRRFLPDGAVQVVSDYYLSFQTQDLALFESVQTEQYMQYRLEDVYGGEYTNQGILEASHESMVSFVGEEYVVALVDITYATSEKAVSNIPTVLDMLDSVSEAADNTKVSEQIPEIYEIKVDLYVDTAASGAKGYTSLNPVTDEVLYVFSLDGSWYLVS